jgi:hypothetical protein
MGVIQNQAVLGTTMVYIDHQGQTHKVTYQSHGQLHQQQ